MSSTIDLTFSPEAPQTDDSERLQQVSPMGEEKKAKLIHKAVAVVDEHLDPAERETAAQVIAKFYEHVPPGDVAARGPRDLGGGALSLWRFAQRRRAGHAKIRIYNPEPDIDGWVSPYTIVEIVNDDMPFLVDSVTAAINASERIVQLVIHPLVKVERDAAGRLNGSDAADRRYIAGSRRCACRSDRLAANATHAALRARPVIGAGRATGATDGAG
jgi:NAD-specific glutamate dehydrogenase